MAEFRRENAQIIKERRIELGLEEPMDAPSDQEARTTDWDVPPNKDNQEKNHYETQVTQPLQTSDHGAPPDDANIPPLQTLDTNKENAFLTQQPNQDAP